MKQGIHPTYYPDALVVCGTCGTTWHAGSTKKEIHVDICSNCHPFFTGTQRIVDTAGQVERFTKRLAVSESKAVPGEARVSKKQRRAAERAKRSGMLEAQEPEPVAEAAATPAPEATAEAAETPTAEAAAETPAASAPRERKPRPPRERKPRAEKSEAPAENTSAE